MRNAFDRTVWTVIAAALTLIALNPWIAPGRLDAQSRIMDVNIRQINNRYMGPKNPLYVRVVK